MDMLGGMLANMLGIGDMVGTYEDCKVGRWDSDCKKRCVSTCTVTDGKVEYETAIAHEDFNDGQLVIVGMYATKEEALRGHAAWVHTLETNTLPDGLIDVDNSGLLGGPRTFKRGEGFPDKEGD